MVRRCSAVSLARTVLDSAIFLSAFDRRSLRIFSLVLQCSKVGRGGVLDGGQLRLLLLKVLEQRVLVLGHLLDGGDLAQEAFGVRGDDELRCRVEVAVLEPSERDLPNLILEL